MNAKPCPAIPLPAPPVNILLPLPLTPSPIKDSFVATAQLRGAIVRRRSSTFRAISRWALAVQPGSPPPNSPLRSPCGSPSSEAHGSLHSRRPSVSSGLGFTRRRPSNSISHGPAQPGSASFLLIDTPTTAGFKHTHTPSSIQKGFNLTNLGYTSVFVHLPHTPSTPSPFLARAHDTTAHVHVPVPPVPQSPVVAQKKGLKRFRSLGLLRPSRAQGKSVSAAIQNVAATATAVASTSSTHRRSRSRSGSISPSSPVHRVTMSSKAKTHRPKSRSVSNPTSANVKKAGRFADAPPLPPTLASELLLMQFIDGGSLESHAKRVMEKQARALAPAGSNQASKKHAISGSAEPLPLGTVFRDERGQIWWDEDEALEYKALLPPASPDSPSHDWVTFNMSSKASAPEVAAGDEDEERRGSVTSVSSTLSVSLNHLVTPAPADGSAHAMHLLRSSFSYASTTPVNPLAIPNTVNTCLATASGAAARNKRTRRRPAPLKLHSSSAISNHANAFEDSFVPSPMAVAMASITPVRRRHRASTSRMSAPASCIEFASSVKSRRGAVDRDGDVVMKENECQVNVEEGHRDARERAMMKKKASKINLRSRAKALFGGLA